MQKSTAKQTEIRNLSYEEFVQQLRNKPKQIYVSPTIGFIKNCQFTQFEPSCDTVHYADGSIRTWQSETEYINRLAEQAREGDEEAKLILRAHGVIFTEPNTAKQNCCGCECHLCLDGRCPADGKCAPPLRVGHPETEQEDDDDEFRHT
jgi:hypothetical protein